MTARGHRALTLRPCVEENDPIQEFPATSSDLLVETDPRSEPETGGENGHHDAPCIRVEAARPSDVEAAVRLVRSVREVFPFLPRSIYERAAAEGELFVCRSGDRLVGSLHFHHRKDGATTIHEIAVSPADRGRGAGRRMLDQLEVLARKRGQKRLRLKCPVDQPANGFYYHAGFRRTGVEAGPRRHVAVWERDIRPVAVDRGAWDFYASMTSGASDIRQLIRRYHEGYASRGQQPPLNPFQRIIFTPLFSSPVTLALFREMASEAPDTGKTGIPFDLPRPKVMLDCGGYQVQMGKMSYETLCSRLRSLYDRERWADHYVLPDHVPLSTDDDTAAEKKADDTLLVGRNFLTWLPELREQFVGVVHGRTEARVQARARAWNDLGVEYLAFGSFGTSGPNGSVNLVSQRSLDLLSALSETAGEAGQQVHVFGVGNPGYLKRISVNGTVADSFDSSGWWKMAGFGYILYKQKFVNICCKGRMTKTMTSLMKDLPLSDHACPFCEDIQSLQKHRWTRVLHNLTCYGEIVAKNHGSTLSYRP